MISCLILHLIRYIMQSDMASTPVHPSHDRLYNKLCDRGRVQDKLCNRGRVHNKLSHRASNRVYSGIS